MRLCERGCVDHHLYRIFDARDRLLYVGISKSALRRLSEHLRKDWPISRVEIVTFDGVEAARSAESFAIRTEGPLLNIAGSTGPPARKQTKEPRKWKLNWYWLKEGEVPDGPGPEHELGEIIHGMETPFYMYWPDALTARQVWWDAHLDKWPGFTVDQTEAVLMTCGRFVKA